MADEGGKGGGWGCRTTDCAVEMRSDLQDL